VNLLKRFERCERRDQPIDKAMEPERFSSADELSEFDPAEYDAAMSATLERWKQEDVRWLDEENRLIQMSHRLREVDEKIEQLRAVSANGTLIGGFSLVVLAEMSIDPFNTAEWLLTLYTATSAITVCLMSYSFMTCTLISVGLLKKFEFESFEDIDRAPFDIFWETTCKRDWIRAYVTYSLGVLSFLINLIFGGWVRFNNLTWPGAVMTIVIILTILFIFFTTHAKWGRFVLGEKTD